MNSKTASRSAGSIKALSFRFVLIIGIVNLFADMTYEGGRGIAGPFLGSLGASAAVVGFVAGFGELLGYGLRSMTGYFADKTHRYWAVIFTGYAINMLAVPALALAGNWPLAAGLLVAERTGRAIRKPSVETMISHAGKSIGQGWVFGLNEALDQTGATIGPLLTALVLYLRGGYHYAFALLLIPALLCLGVLVLARLRYPRPHELEERIPKTLEVQGFSRTYWVYVAAGALVAAGFADFSLMAFHFRQARILPDGLIPVFYAVAMVTSALASLAIGRWLDRIGRPVVVTALLLSLSSPALVFLAGPMLALVGVILWGIGTAALDSALKPLIVHAVSPTRRGTAFGVFDTAFGIAWFAGSGAMGLLYEKSLPALVAFSMLLQFAALPVLLATRDGRKRD